MAYEVLSRRMPLLLSTNAAGESFVVHGADEWIGSSLFSTGEFEFDKFASAIEALRMQRPSFQARVLVDVGANIGPICIPAVARGLVERAVAIEPDPRNYRLLRTNVELNDLALRIRTVQKAAGAIDGETLRLELSPSNLGDHRIRVGKQVSDPSGPEREAFDVPSDTLDSICAPELDSDLLLWMDLQGYEGIALLGAPSLLARKVPVVVEFEPKMMARTGSFAALQRAVSDYTGFVDLGCRSGLRAISELDAFRVGLEQAGRITDILLV